MLDQYGDKVPDDLVYLPDPVFLSEDEVNAVIAAPWYETRGHLAASFSAMGGLGFEDTSARAPVTKVENWQKAYSVADGFYHA